MKIVATIIVASQSMFWSNILLAYHMRFQSLKMIENLPKYKVCHHWNLSHYWVPWKEPEQH